MVTRGGMARRRRTLNLVGDKVAGLLDAIHCDVGGCLCLWLGKLRVRDGFGLRVKIVVGGWREEENRSGKCVVLSIQRRA